MVRRCRLGHPSGPCGHRSANKEYLRCAAEQQVSGCCAHRALGVAVQLIWAVRVHAAHEDRLVPRSSERVRKGRSARVEVVVIRPALVLVRVAACEHAHAGWCANRARAVAVVEGDASRAQAIQVRSPHDRVAVAASDKGTVLV